MASELERREPQVGEGRHEPALVAAPTGLSTTFSSTMRLRSAKTSFSEWPVDMLTRPISHARGAPWASPGRRHQLDERHLGPRREPDAWATTALHPDAAADVERESEAVGIGIQTALEALAEARERDEGAVAGQRHLAAMHMAGAEEVHPRRQLAGDEVGERAVVEDDRRAVGG